MFNTFAAVFASLSRSEVSVVSVAEEFYLVKFQRSSTGPIENGEWNEVEISRVHCEAVAAVQSSRGRTGGAV